MGYSLKGKWIRKLEFQDGGWSHFHLIIEAKDYIPHDDLYDIWGHGFAYINKMSKKRLHYFTKYIAKTADQLPNFLKVEPTRSIKIIAASPTWWHDTPKTKQTEEPKDKKLSWCVFTPTGEVFKKKTILKTEFYTRTIHSDICTILQHLVSNGSWVLGSQHEYISVVTTPNALQDAISNFADSTCIKHNIDTPNINGDAANACVAASLLLDNRGKSTLSDDYLCLSDEALDDAISLDQASALPDYYYEAIIECPNNYGAGD